MVYLPISSLIGCKYTCGIGFPPPLSQIRVNSVPWLNGPTTLNNKHKQYSKIMMERFSL